MMMWGVGVQAKPLEADCEKEGKVVCNNGHIKGQPGVETESHAYNTSQAAARCLLQYRCFSMELLLSSMIILEASQLSPSAMISQMAQNITPLQRYHDVRDCCQHAAVQAGRHVRLSAAIAVDSREANA